MWPCAPQSMRAGAQSDREGCIWRRVMAHYHGADWRAQARRLTEEDWTLFLTDATGSSEILEAAMRHQRELQEADAAWSQEALSPREDPPLAAPSPRVAAADSTAGDSPAGVAEALVPFQPGDAPAERAARTERAATPSSAYEGGSSVGSEGSWKELNATQLLEIYDREFDPETETIQNY